MGMDKSEFETLVKDTTAEAVKGIMDANNEKLADVIDTKIKEAVVDVEKRIVVGKEEIDKDPTAGFKTLSNFGVHVYKANKGIVSEELRRWETKAAGDPSQNISDNEAGAYLIPPEWNSEIIKPVMQEDLAFGRTRKVPMQRNTIAMPYINGYDESSGKTYGNVSGTWMSEEEAHSASSMKFGKLQLSLKKLGLLAFVTEEMISDSPASMEVILRDSFRDALTFELNSALIRGSGAGRPQGILNSPALVSVTAETGQAASTILFENIVKMYSRTSDTANSIWMVNPNTLPQLATMSLAVGTGGIPVWIPSNSASGRPYDTLFGLPVVYNKHCSALGTVGDIILVDWNQYYVGLKAGAEGNGVYSSSAHLKFDYDQYAYKYVFRVDGQCAWKSAVTPPQATSDTISPIVVLATRS